MRKFEYRPPRVHTGELRTPVTFYRFAPNDGPEPGESEEEVLYNAWAKIDEVWLKDVELAKSTGTLSDVTITIRDTQGEYRPSNKHYVSIDDPAYEGNRYNIKHVQPDMQHRDFINVIAGMS